MTAEEIGKARIQSAKKLAETHGIDVMGWNDKRGKEFISVFNASGDNEKLQVLQKEMEKNGWIAHPVEEKNEGYYMDFGMQKPPTDLKRQKLGANGTATSTSQCTQSRAGEKSSTGNPNPLAG